jgi:hypothetical protein
VVQYYNSCGSVKFQVVDAKWNCDRCRSERLHLLEEKLQNAVIQIDELERKNKELEEELQLTAAEEEAGKRNTAPVRQEGKNCLVPGDSIVRNVGTEHSNMTDECFPGVRTEQLHRFIENRDLGNPDTIVINVGAKDLRSTRNLDYLMGVVYKLVATAKSKCTLDLF